MYLYYFRPFSDAFIKSDNGIITLKSEEELTTLGYDTPEEVEKIVPNLHFIRNRALLKELVLYNPDINVDRLRSLGMVMLYRGQFVDMFEGNLSRAGNQEPVEEDDYFKHYDEMIKVYEKDFN